MKYILLSLLLIGCTGVCDTGYYSSGGYFYRKYPDSYYSGPAYYYYTPGLNYRYYGHDSKHSKHGGYYGGYSNFRDYNGPNRINGYTTNGTYIGKVW